MKWHGWLGLLMITFGEFLIFKRIEPFSSYLFFQLLWFGYIFFIDAVVYSRKKRSLIINKPYLFIFTLVLSMLFWWIFEFLNIGIRNWGYSNVAEPQWLMFSIAFSTVVPTVFETTEFLMTTKLFKDIKLKKGLRINNLFLIILFVVGAISLVFLFIFPKYTFFLAWISLILLVEPINYKMKDGSLLRQLEKGKVRLILCLMFGGLICGFLWEFWNYWAPAKWTYDIPFVEFLKIFEMPLLGYLGYLPFALELFTMYNLVINIFGKKTREKLKYFNV